jgi:NAD(P)H-nitrite reductase large subunit
MTRYVIIGTGVSGIAAAEGIRKVDKNGTITFIGEDPHGFYSRPGLAYYLTGEMQEKSLYPYQPDDYKGLNARFMRGMVTRILPEAHEVEVNQSARVPYDRLLLAMGAGAVKLTVPGANLEGVVKLDHMEDAQRIVSLAKHARVAVVVGGGITALELAEGLAARRVKVHLLIRTERYWSNVLDEVESRILEKRLAEDGIVIHPTTELTEILGKNGKVAGIRTAKGEQIPCNVVAYAIGVQPRAGLAKAAGIACERGILADEHLRTNLADIFAAGDVAQVFDPASGRSVIDSLWNPAREQGHVAGLNMAGRTTAYLKSVPFNVTRLGGLTTTIIGAVGSGQDGDPVTIARGDSETWRDIPDAIIAQSGFDVNHLRLMIGQKTIVGAILMGDQKLSSPLQAIIRDKVDISPVREQLIAPNAPIADILAHFWAQVHASRN